MKNHFLPVFSALLLLFCAACEGESGTAAATEKTSTDTDEFWAVDAGSSADAGADDAEGTGRPADVDKTCYDGCLAKGADKVTCESACKKGGTKGSGDCYDACIKKGQDKESCSKACKGDGGGKTGGGCAGSKDDGNDPKDAKLYDQGCMDSCAAKKVPVADCKCYCPAKGSGGGDTSCYDTCVKLGADKDGCKKECDVKDAGIKKNGNEACYNVCTGGGGEAVACKAKCYPSKDDGKK